MEKIFAPGYKVVFNDFTLHKFRPKYYPKPGTVGTVLARVGEDYYIRWPKGSTSIDDMWFSHKDHLEPYKERKAENVITIMRDADYPRVIIAEDLTTGKKAKARCNPEDDFDFYTGAKLALERLAEKSKPEQLKVGDAVVFVDETQPHDRRYSPAVGTVGTLIYKAGEKCWLVQWPHGSIDGNPYFKSLCMSDWLRKTEKLN